GDRSALLALEGKTTYGRMFEWVGMNTYILPFACRVPPEAAIAQPAGGESGGASSRPTTTQASAHDAISKDKAIRIAVEHLRGKGHLSREYRVEASFRDGEWYVT